MTTKPVEACVDPTVGKWLRLKIFAAATLVASGFLLVPAAASAAVQPTLDRDVFLSAVAEVETGGNARAVGRRGERGQYQFTRATWQRHSSRPFADAHNPTVAHDVAVRHFNWLRNAMLASGSEPTTYRMAVAWNAGLNRSLSGSAPRSTREYARRVSNLASIQSPPTRPQLAAKPPQVAATAPVPVRAPVAPVLFSADRAATEVAPIGFSLSWSEAVAPDTMIATDVTAEPAEEVSFTLARPAATPATSPRRIIFATIGE